jgi:hypothetical protein
VTDDPVADPLTGSRGDTRFIKRDRMPGVLRVHHCIEGAPCDLGAATVGWVVGTRHVFPGASCQMDRLARDERRDLGQAPSMDRRACA